MLEDYLKSDAVEVALQPTQDKPKPTQVKSKPTQKPPLPLKPTTAPSPTRRSIKPRPANLLPANQPGQPNPLDQIVQELSAIDLTVSTKPPVPPRPAPRKRVKGILKNKHQNVEIPIEAQVDPFMTRGHVHSASVRERRTNHSSRPKVSGYQSEMDPKMAKACSKRLRRTRSTDLVGYVFF